MATGGETKYSCCSPCLDDGRNTVARHYCVECEMYFCTKCVKCHNKIPSLKTHQVNDVNSSDSTTSEDETIGQGSDSVYGLRCTLHRDKLIDTYCKDHDEVCCGACATVKHRLCTNVAIAVAAKDFKTSPERNTCTESLNTNIEKLVKEKEIRIDNSERIGKQKLELIETVDKYEEKLIAKIKELTNNSRTEIRSKYEEHKTAIDMDIATLDVAIATNTEYTKQLEQSDDEQQFVYFKFNKSVTKDEEMLLQAMTTDYMELEIRYCFHETLDNHILKMKSFGLLEGDCTFKEYKATLDRIINIKRNNDSKDTYVRDVCVMDSGELLVTDDDNRKLKRFNSDFQFKDEIKLAGCPIAGCKIDEHEVAVRLWGTNVVQFVSVGQTMKLNSYFTLAGSGWGMTYDDGTGEILACENKKVSIYSKTGKHLRTFDKDTKGVQLFSDCKDIALSMSKQDIYVTDREKGLIVLDKSGTLKIKVSLIDVRQQWPLCVLPRDIVLVGGRTSGVIGQVNSDGKQVGNLIDTQDGRSNTRCVSYDREHSRLIVGGYPSVLSVYTLSSK